MSQEAMNIFEQTLKKAKALSNDQGGIGNVVETAVESMTKLVKSNADPKMLENAAKSLTAERLRVEKLNKDTAQERRADVKQE